MVATEGAHRFFDDNAGSIKSFRRQPLVFGGYSIGIRADKLHVQLADDFYRELRGYLVNQAVHRSAARLAQEIYELPVEPFGPVQRQLRKILREVNAERKTAGMARVPGRAIPCRLRIVRLQDPIASLLTKVAYWLKTCSRLAAGSGLETLRYSEVDGIRSAKKGVYARWLVAKTTSAHRKIA